MSWAHGFVRLRDGSELEAGYAVRSACMADGCMAMIDRGLAFRCGGVDFDAGCGRFFCGEHYYDHDCPYCDEDDEDDE